MFANAFQFFESFVSFIKADTFCTPCNISQPWLANQWFKPLTNTFTASLQFALANDGNETNQLF